MNDNPYDPDHPTRQTWWLGTEGDNRRRLMTSTWDLRLERHRLMLDACLRAEAEGDADVALEILRNCRGFCTRSWQRLVKEPLRLGNSAPTWVLGRWIRSQALRWMMIEHDERLARSAREAIDATWMVKILDVGESFPHELLVEAAHLDAVCHHRALYDLGGLADYVDLRLGTPLRERIPMIRQWADSEMAFYNLVSTSGRYARVIRSDHPAVEVRDLGYFSGLPDGTLFLGRIVPIAERPGHVFEEPPIEIDPVTAEHILYGSPSLKLPLWLEALGTAVAEGRMPVGVASYGPTGFVSDL